MTPQPTDVIYRVIGGEVTAILPDYECNRGRVMTYVHLGQHGEADTDYCRGGRLARPEEYAALHRELQSIYEPEYTLRIMKRVNWGKVRRGWVRR